MSKQLRLKFKTQIQQLLKESYEAHTKGELKKSQELNEYASQLKLHFEEMIQEAV
jgi:hypothetical protein